MKIDLIRHGATPGNLKHRYIGVTDEALCKQGIAELEKIKPFLQRRSLLITSPLLRCTQTAEILFPGQKIVICRDFRECDFGDFENQNYQELSGNPAYQHWIDSNGTACFPNGEPPEDFKNRTVRAFEKIINNLTFHQSNTSIAIIAHGGTIMAILEKFAIPKKNYYDYQISNACGYQTELKISENSNLLPLHILTKFTPESAINC
ncbi:MAG: histidine phosphatase family protein [Oscillospiraceae bacterium]|nr:histidine phosphatase family protein [Oscillospiraceae bacterium]